MNELGFFLKKLISFFVEPYGLFLFFLILGLYLLFIQRVKLSKIILSFSLSIVILFSYSPFSNFLVKNLENKYPKYDYSKNIKYIHVLGSGHNADESQPISSHIGSAGIKRVLEGIIIHKQIEGSKIIFTGYGGDMEVSTAKINANLAIALGVKEENIILGENPKDTQEEALFTKKLLNGESFVLVTSASHMPRSMMLFESLGLNPVAAPTDFLRTFNISYLKAPSIESFYNSQRAMHEYYGILWNKLRSK